MSYADAHSYNKKSLQRERYPKISQNTGLNALIMHKKTSI